MPAVAIPSTGALLVGVSDCAAVDGVDMVVSVVAVMAPIVLVEGVSAVAGGAGTAGAAASVATGRGDVTAPLSGAGASTLSAVTLTAGASMVAVVVSVAGAGVAVGSAGVGPHAAISMAATSAPASTVLGSLEDDWGDGDVDVGIRSLNLNNLDMQLPQQRIVS